MKHRRHSAIHLLSSLSTSSSIHSVLNFSGFVPFRAATVGLGTQLALWEAFHERVWHSLDCEGPEELVGWVTLKARATHAICHKSEKRDASNALDQMKKGYGRNSPTTAASFSLVAWNFSVAVVASDRHSIRAQNHGRKCVRTPLATPPLSQ
jgi:hypothetical protein